MLRTVFDWTLDLHESGRDALFTRSSGCFCAISIPIKGMLSFLKKLLSCPVVIENGVSSDIHPLDCFLTTIFLIMFIVSLVKPQ